MQWNPRYERHYSLPGFGSESQEKLALSKVLVIGAGGLGCPVLQYLAASGVGRIGVVDFDVIQLSNLQRQPLYTTATVGQLKTEVAVERIRLINPDIQIIEYPIRLDQDNAHDILQEYDIVVDCTDNFSVRYLINDYCVLLQKPLVFAAIYQYEGQVAIFNVKDDQGIACNYRDLFPEVPRAEEAPNCVDNGVLGVLPGLIGLMQATEVIKLITHIGEPLVNKLMIFNLLTYQSMILEITHNSTVSIVDPREINTRIDALDHFYLTDERKTTIQEEIAMITVHEIEQFVHEPTVCVLDVREIHERPEFPLTHHAMPLSILPNHLDELTAAHIIVVCQSGQRSLQAGKILKKYFGNQKRISHLEGGIMGYLNYSKA
ncbi:HesA/MoeB/ThiF family protein [Sphingobacterium sp. SRCM116780]|uniref:HesA/MoeB/ThiF family protein n=1 Tax=Sphingobacterium sp. SRCM116780 TaxID=2907623 RepID=UPI001F1EC6F4|nr:HesA/MoeB/ThiF family protein [Sphingobacterium sp. SRCM116780]UIR56854.1 HesA/MoeB/ThiF family protein [Sphingobacterium sp. SRCM116780]